MENCIHECNVFDPDLDDVFDEMPDVEIAPSFNGRTSDSESEYGGSNPSGAAKI